MARLRLLDFTRDAQRIWKDKEARAALLGLAAGLALITSGIGAAIGYALSLNYVAWQGALIGAFVWVGLGAILGSMLANVQRHPRRRLGLVPFAAAGFFAAFAWVVGTPEMTWPWLLLGAMGALAIVPLRAAYLAAVPAEARGSGAAVMSMANALLAAILALLTYGLAHFQIPLPSGYLWFVAILAALGVVIAWWALQRDSLELLIEFLIWPFYRIRGHGPGLLAIPSRGPMLVFANHTAWFDPVWLAKVLPRRLTPMMTSRFFDLPVLHWLMTRVVHAIRVQAGKVQREPPEIKEAIAALDRGECVIIFPEGYMRRRPDRTLNHFGQGIWRIFSARPEVPVVPCWIEGGWGSYASYAGGPPTKNKRLDRWRPIKVAVALPQVLDASLLADQRETRSYLMQACLDARQYLGLEPAKMADEPNGPTKDEEDSN